MEIKMEEKILPYFCLSCFEMLKKVFIIFLLGLAYAVLLGHSIIPHHHDDDVLAHHQHHEEGKLGDLFSHLQHYDKKDFCYLQTEHKEIHIDPFFLALPNELEIDFSLKHFVFSYYSSEAEHHYSPPLCSFKPLRAPPYYCS